MSPEARRAIIAERDAIRLVVAAAAAHRDDVRSARDDPWVLAAAGGVLHSFYGGVENILKAVARGCDEPLPSGTSWHSDLLKQLSTATTNRPAVLTPVVVDRLRPYLGFRHVYRSQYAMRLDADRLGDLMDGLPAVWQAVEAALDSLDDPSQSGG